VLQPHLERVSTKQGVAERMKGRDLDIRVAVRHELIDARLHLGGGFVGEGESENLLRPCLALRDQVRDAPRDDGGLASARPGHDEQWPGVMGDSLTLSAIEAVKDPTPHAPRL